MKKLLNTYSDIYTRERLGTHFSVRTWPQSERVVTEPDCVVLRSCIVTYALLDRSFIFHTTIFSFWCPGGLCVYPAAYAILLVDCVNIPGMREMKGKNTHSCFLYFTLSRPSLHLAQHMQTFQASSAVEEGRIICREMRLLLKRLPCYWQNRGQRGCLWGAPCLMDGV